ncbi:MAG: type II toxin-antitoxin system VapB family antitoxin [Deltaproteobacteria bacterium]|nr:type II toxin-antitoxin system VapB family antitoxin [Deltaproteobacteria bacterium]
MLVRTTIELDEKLLQEAVIATGVKKKRQLIELALQEVVRQRRIDRLRQRLGKTSLTITGEDLRRMRADD